MYLNTNMFLNISSSKKAYKAFIDASSTLDKKTQKLHLYAELDELASDLVSKVKKFRAFDIKAFNVFSNATGWMLEVNEEYQRLFVDFIKSVKIDELMNQIEIEIENSSKIIFKVNQESYQFYINDFLELAKNFNNYKKVKYAIRL
ncbi:MAG: hypothetical protein ACK41T_08335 [Pseudobdellovibrio sp.]